MLIQHGKNDVKPRRHKSLNVRIPADLNRRLSVHCAEREITKAEFVIEAIEEKLTREGTTQSIASQGIEERDAQKN